MRRCYENQHLTHQPSHSHETKDNRTARNWPKWEHQCTHGANNQDVRLKLVITPQCQMEAFSILNENIFN